MFNLLRMDLYRVKRSKSVYVCFGLLLLGTVFTFGLTWLMGTKPGQEISVSLGMISLEEAKELDGMLGDMDLLRFFRQICLDGGSYNLIFGIWVMLFVCADFQSGFIKNIMALHQNRWNYIGSKVITAWIVDFCYLVFHLLFTMLMNRLFGNMLPYTGWKDIVFYISWVWFLTTAFASLTIFICILTRSVAAGSVAVVLLSSGAIVRPLCAILESLHMGEWLEYSIVITCDLGPQRLTSVKDLYVYVVGFGFLILYTMISGIVLRKKDI